MMFLIRITAAQLLSGSVREGGREGGWERERQREKKRVCEKQTVLGLDL